MKSDTHRGNLMLKFLNNITAKASVLVFVVVSLAACSSISVTSDWDTSVDFSQFKTFAILENEKPTINRLIDQRIVDAIAADLVAKGLQHVDTTDRADLAIGYQVTTEERTSFHTVHSGWGAYGYPSSRSGWYGGTPGSSRATQVNYTVGTLVIPVFQMANKELIWEGSGSGVVNPSRTPEQSVKHINDAVQSILKGFPPGAAPAK